MNEAGLRGRLGALGAADILEFLRILNRRGLLSLQAPGAGIGLYLDAGSIVHATSTREADRLTACLLKSGVLTPEQHEEAMRRAASGERVGKSILAITGLPPRALLEARLCQVRGIALSVFEWGDGTWEFHEGETPRGEGIEVDLRLDQAIADGIRQVRTEARFEERMPSPDWVFEAIPPADVKSAVVLEPQEEYVLRLVDGRRTVRAVAEASEFPRHETLRALFLLSAAGFLVMRSPAASEDGGETVDVAAIAARYNAMLSRVHGFLQRALGPIAEDLLAKTLRDLAPAHPVPLRGAVLGGDGTLDPARLERSLAGLGAARQREALVRGLNELLYAELFVLRRTLGAGDETRVMKMLRDDGVHPGPHESPARRGAAVPEAQEARR
jgi:hypothetical protein